MYSYTQVCTSNMENESFSRGDTNKPQILSPDNVNIKAANSPAKAV